MHRHQPTSARSTPRTPAPCSVLQVSESEFLSAISHELRTPMNAIMGFSQLLRLEPLSTSQADSVDEIEKASKRLLTLINQVLDLNKINAGHLSLELEPVDLAQSVRNCLQQLEPLAHVRGIQLQAQLTALGVLADEQRLHQVLLNLLSNAIKYNRDHGQVRVAATVQPDSQVRLSVQDTGYGIPVNQRHTVFAPFQRGAAERSGIEGTGIGLSITQRVVQHMGGNIGFNSSDGVGTEFWVTLPGAGLTGADSHTASAHATPTDPEQLMALTYVSTAAHPMSAQELDGIVQHSKDFNPSVGVTGMLLYHDGNFFQYLEGPARGLEVVMERVRRSRRHHSLYIHFKGAIERRHFGDWSMDVADLSKPRTLKNAEQLRRLEQAWHNGDTTCVAVRLLLNFAEHMTGIGHWGQRPA